jgi:uncharacterized protein YgiM (DUF1202 family)
MRLRTFIIPLLLIPLVLALASPAVHAYSGQYYVIPSSVQLRECPGYDCRGFLTAYQGDKVEILERTGSGWSRVRLVDRSGWGWMPSDLLSYSPDLRPGPGQRYFVNINSLPLRDAPTSNFGVITTLHFNDPVEMLGVDSSGMAQVRELRHSLVGWVPPRYLSSEPLGSPKSTKPRRRWAPKPVPKEEPPAAPKAM